MQLPFDIVVAANKHRPPLITAWLETVGHAVSITPDYQLPAGFDPSRLQYESYRNIATFNQAAYRCFRAHQDALNHAKQDRPTLIFEDDAVPNTADWLEQCVDASDLLSQFEIVSMHSRAVRADKVFEHKNRRFATPRVNKERGLKVMHGALAYLIRPDASLKLRGMEFRQHIDLCLANEFEFCYAMETPFNHGMPGVTRSVFVRVKKGLIR